MDTAQQLHKASVRIDQRLRIGTKIIIVPTDIDDNQTSGGVHLTLRGELVGGPDDGALMHENRELRIGNRIEMGTLIGVVLLKISNGVAHFGVTCPTQFVVFVE